jgi:hypothetical protein
MKNLIILLILSMTFFATSCVETTSSELENPCVLEELAVVTKTRDCNVNNSTLADETIYQQLTCQLYSVTQESVTHDSCINNLELLTCEEFVNMDSVQGFEDLGCFNYPKGTKKDACAINYKSYCSSSFYECGETALSGICLDASSIYGSSESREIDFDTSKLKTYCASTINGDEDVELDDSFSRICPQYRDELVCDSIPDFDFRNDDWKTQCIEQ